MILVHRQALAVPGRMFDAIQFANEVTARVNELLPDSQVRVGSGVGGPLYTLHWFSQYENMAALERAQDQLLGDEQYLSLLVRGGELFVAGHIKDEIIRTL